jgi:hypothetical protein
MSDEQDPAKPPITIHVMKPKPSKNPNHSIVREVPHLDNEGRCIIQHVLVRGPKPEDYCEFIAENSTELVVPADSLMTQMVKEMKRFRVPLDVATTLIEAFDLYDDVCQKFSDELQADVDRQVAERQDMLNKAEEKARLERLKQSNGWQPPPNSGGKILRP